MKVEKGVYIIDENGVYIIDENGDYLLFDDSFIEFAI